MNSYRIIIYHIKRQCEHNMEVIMIKKIQNIKDLKRFIYYAKDLYHDDPHYIYPLFSILKKELKQEVLLKKTYTAILYQNEENQIQGRLLYQISFNPKTNRNICYWSYFDAINSDDVTKALFEFMENDMKAHDVFYSEGSFTPYDPDNRRGILVQGFDSDPVIFTSYNKEYIPTLLETYGFSKSRDTFSIKPEDSEDGAKRLERFSQFFERKYNIDVDYINLNQVDREIKDIHEILSAADHEIIYQEIPSIDLIKSVAENMKMFLDKRIIMIAREHDTRKPVGFFFCLLDFNQVFKKLKGKIRPIRMILGKRKITKVRGMMQYVIPQYQKTGLLGYIYKKIYDEFMKMGITEFEGGTIMESNESALTTFSMFNGKIANIYRIYGKEISK